MSLDDYLKQNIKADVLQKVDEFRHSSDFEVIKTFTSTSKYQSAKMQLKQRDKEIHKSTLDDIQKLQNEILTQ